MKTTHYILFTALQALAPCFGWEISVHTNEFNDVKSYIFHTAGTLCTNDFSQSYIPALAFKLTPVRIIRPKNQLQFQTEAFISLPSDIIDCKSALVRFDKSPATNFTGTISTDFHSLFFDAALPLLAKMKQPHKQILFRITTFGNNQRTIRFRTESITPTLQHWKKSIMADPPPNVEIIK